MDVEIERANADDLEAIADMWVDLARGQRAHDSYVRAADNREAMRETLAAHQSAGGLFVARADGRPVGFASSSIERGTLALDATRGTLTNLYVEPDYRNRGVGSALLETVESAFAEADVDAVILEVMADNDDARRFYRRHGYDPLRVTMHRRLENQPENDTHSKEEP